jgi:hypothetical protein
MDSVKKFNADLYGGPGTFPRVEEFLLVDLKCLEE